MRSGRFRQKIRLWWRALLCLGLFGVWPHAVGADMVSPGSSPKAAAQDATVGPDVATLGPAVLALAQHATFEVIVKKPTHDGLSYRKPLPLDLLPYSQRTDKYDPVGTAFAIGANRYVTAAHVLSLEQKTQRTVFAIRDTQGHVYPIAQILAFDDRRDFVEFSVLHPPATQDVYQPRRHPRLNERVYAVGNALGEGVVIRGGLLTSRTPEDRDGAWRWIRFSAAASPGNSGGPLLDHDGRLIGIVERKSQNENLNYALPISQLLAANDHEAIMDGKIGYGIDIMPAVEMTILRRQFPLPAPLPALSRELIAAVDATGTHLMEKMFAKHRAEIFPRGPGSTNLLHVARMTNFPALIMEGPAEVWDWYTPKHIHRADLGHSAHLAFGNLGNSTYFHLRMADNDRVARVIAHSKPFMDTLLKGFGYTRTVGPEHIRITSFGRAASRSVYTDGYHRKWLVMEWPIAFSDQDVLLFALPVPDGVVGMLRIGSTGGEAGNLSDLRNLTNFIYVSYYGTLPQWQRFLAMGDLVPPPLTDIALHVDYGHELRYQSPQMAFSYRAQVMNITKHSDLEVVLSYFREHGHVAWGVSRVVVGENKETQTSFAIVRHMRPTSAMDDKYHTTWDDLIRRRFPFNHAVIVDNHLTAIGEGLTHHLSKDQVSSAHVIYSVMYNADGSLNQRTAATRLDTFVHGVDIREQDAAGARRH